MLISFEKSDEIGNQSILENTFDIHFYWECKHCINFFIKNGYMFKIKTITADE